MGIVRHYRQEDLSGCAAVFCSAFGAAPWHESWNIPLAEKRIAELTGTQLSAGYVYEENGVICGFAAGRTVTYLYGREYVIDEFCVSADRQGKGVGSALMQQIKAEMTEAGFAGIVLNTTRGYPSERFYRKHGFTENAEMITMYRVLQKQT